MKDRLQVIKIGGHIINDHATLSGFLASFARLKNPKILVHGGGRKATELGNQMGVASSMVEGRRVTDDQTLEIVTMVYAGLINKNIVAKLQMLNCNAIGLAGCDANILQARKRPSKPVDYGWVGNIQAVDSDMIDRFIQNRVVPVFSAITHDGEGQLLNTNADTIASEIAIAMSAKYETELVYCFEKKGVLMDIHDADSVIETMDRNAYDDLLKQGVIHSGMMPKLENSFRAIDRAVSRVKIGPVELLDNPQMLHTTLIPS